MGYANAIKSGYRACESLFAKAPLRHTTLPEGFIKAAKAGEVSICPNFLEGKIGDVLVRFEDNLKKVASKTVDITKEIRKYNVEELRLLDKQIEAGNSIAQLAEMRGISPDSMRKILAINGRKTLEGQIVASIKDEVLIKLVQEGKSAREIAELFGIEHAGSLTPRLRGLDIAATQSKIERISDEYFRVAYAQGKNAVTIAEELKVAPQFIYRKCKELGLIKEAIIPSQEEINMIRNMVQHEIPQAKIAKRMGYSIGQVRKIISENALKSAREELLDSLPKGEELEKLVIQAGSREKLCRMLGIDKGMADRIMKDSGFKFSTYVKKTILPEESVITRLIDKHPFITPDEIAKILKCEPETVEKAITKYKLYYGFRKQSALQADRLDITGNVVELLNAGDSPQQVAAIFGCSTNRILKILEENPFLKNGLKGAIKIKKDPSKNRFIAAFNAIKSKFKNIENYRCTDQWLEELSTNLKISKATCIRLILKYEMKLPENLVYGLKTNNYGNLEYAGLEHIRGIYCQFLQGII